MIRGTTPTFKLKISDENVDLTQVTNVYATFSQAGKVITKTGDDLEVLANEVDVYLSQEETLSFKFSTLEIQLNWTYEDQKRASTKIAKVSIGRNLINEVIE